MPNHSYTDHLSQTHHRVWPKPLASAQGTHRCLSPSGCSINISWFPLPIGPRSVLSSVFHSIKTSPSITQWLRPTSEESLFSLTSYIQSRGKSGQFHLQNVSRVFSPASLPSPTSRAQVWSLSLAITSKVFSSVLLLPLTAHSPFIS